MNMIYRCMKPNCQFHFPAQTSSKVEFCPKCGSPVQPILPKEHIIPSHSEPKSSVTIELLLDNIRSAYNVGAILRTADSVGVKHVHLLGITPTLDHPKVQKTALGADTVVNWSQYWTYPDFLNTIDRNTYRILCLDGGETSKPLFDQKCDADHSFLLVVGNEIQGIDPEIIDHADSIVYLPMLGFKRSLNVSVACGIALYWLRFLSPTSYQ